MTKEAEVSGGGDDPVLERLREICLALPDTRETDTWGKPHFRVGDKIFVGYQGSADARTIGFKLEPDHGDAIIQHEGFRRAKYVGRYGWISLDAKSVQDWEEVRAFVLESYRLIAPKRSLKKLKT